MTSQSERTDRTAARARAAARWVAAALWSAVLALAVALAAEAWLRFAAAREEREARAKRPRLAALEDAYLPQKHLDLNPLYLFFFPHDLEQRRRENSAVCTISPEGFRGPGPAAASGRPLAFLIGGSTAFGYLCSSDNATLTACLNRIQDRHFFVNAAVPYWNSTQEMYRVAFELLEHRPALIVSLDGANDLEIATAYANGDPAMRLPPGTPAGFDLLYPQFRRGYGEGPRRGPSLLARAFPALRAAWAGRGAGDERGGLGVEESREAARRYIANLGRIGDLARAAGARHVAFLQPFRCLHRNVPEKFGAGSNDRPPTETYVAQVLEAARGRVELEDFSRFFDTRFDEVPCLVKKRRPDLADDLVFVDEVHLYDAGNELLARGIAERIAARGP